MHFLKKSLDIRIGNLIDTSFNLLYLISYPFIQHITNLCCNLSGSYGLTTNVTHPNALSFNDSQICASTLVVDMI